MGVWGVTHADRPRGGSARAAGYGNSWLCSARSCCPQCCAGSGHTPPRWPHRWPGTARGQSGTRTSGHCSHILKNPRTWLSGSWHRAHPSGSSSSGTGGWPRLLSDTVTQAQPHSATRAGHCCSPREAKALRHRATSQPHTRSAREGAGAGAGQGWGQRWPYAGTRGGRCPRLGPRAGR